MHVDPVPASILVAGSLSGRTRHEDGVPVHPRSTLQLAVGGERKSRLPPGRACLHTSMSGTDPQLGRKDSGGQRKKEAHKAKGRCDT